MRAPTLEKYINLFLVPSSSLNNILKVLHKVELEATYISCQNKQISERSAEELKVRIVTRHFLGNMFSIREPQG